MKKKQVLFTIIIFTFLFQSIGNSCAVNASNKTSAQEKFIISIKDEALNGYRDYNICPSLTIAQAILESGWGNSLLTKKGYNLFGIKAYNDWKGKTINLSSKEYNSNGSYYKVSAFKVYNDFTESIRDHNILLSQNNYKRVQNANNYIDSCYAILDCGYATSPNYAKALINIIETYHLYKYDDKSQIKPKETKIPKQYVIKETIKPNLKHPIPKNQIFFIG